MVQLKFLNNIWRKKLLFSGIILILLLLVGANYVISLSSSKKEITPFVTYPPEGEYVHGQVIVAFRDGYIPKQLENEIGDEKNKNIINKLGTTLKNENLNKDMVIGLEYDEQNFRIKDISNEIRNSL